MNPRLKFQAYHDYVIEKIESTVNGTGKRNLIIAMPPRHTKPLDVDTLILMSDGMYKRLGDIQAGDYIINRLGRAGRVEEVHEQGVRPVLKITTHSGRSVRAEASHPFWTPNGWLMAGYLEPGDTLANVNRPQPMEVKNDRRPEEFRLAGYLTGDGSISGNNAAFTNIDPEVLSDITRCVETLGFKIRRQHPDRPTYQLTSGIRDWLRDNGMADTDSRTKRVPSWVFNATPDLIAEFVAAYFACDGCVTGRGFAQGRRDVLVEFSCIQRPLLEDTQRLLLRLGIQSRIRARQSTYTYKGNSKPVTSYSLALPSTDDVDKFATRIPVVGAKRERLIVAEHRRTSFDGDWLPDAVVSVEHDGEAECRCLSIGGDPSFTANDLVVHNTEIVSNNLPAWILGRNPNAKIILASYNLELAMRNSRIARNKLDDPRWPFPEVALAQDSKAAQRWGTSDGGEVLAAGVGAGITGFGADVLIIDDYLRGREDADRKTERDRVWAWFREDASTRGQPGFKTICMATRWHSDDLIGRILNEPGALDEWEVVSLPALAEPGDPLGRVEGEPLDPERYPVHELLRIKARIGPRGWGALYQQRPTPAEGNLIKREWWQFYDPSEMKRKGLKATAMTVDPAFGAGDNNDPSVVGVWGMLNGRYYLMDVWRKSVSYPQLRLALGELYRKWHVTAVIEDIGPGKILLQEMRGASLARDDSTAVPTVAYKLPTVSTRTGGRMQSKLERAEAITNLIEGGLVFLPEKADWLEGYIEEMSGFPTAPHDDQCLVAGTMIATTKGDVPIENVREGDSVLTPLGPCRVTAAGQTGHSAVITRNDITGTPSHPVFTTCKGFRPLDTIIMGVKTDRLSLHGLIEWTYRIQADNQKSSSSTESSTGSWGRSVITSASQQPMKDGSILRDCTSRFGKLCMERKFLQAGTFITKTLTRSITTLQIYSAYRLKNIWRSLGRYLIPKLNSDTSKTSAPSLLRGTRVPRVEHGIRKMPSRQWLTEQWSQEFASSAMSLLNPNNRSLSFARISAGNGISVVNPDRQSSAIASSAGSSSVPLFRSTRTRSHRPVAAHAELDSGSNGNNLSPKIVPVYNLTVEGAGCYYANGTLVSNCDMTVMALSRLSAVNPALAAAFGAPTRFSPSFMRSSA